MSYFLALKGYFTKAYSLKAFLLFGFLRVAIVGHFDTSGEDTAGCLSYTSSKNLA